jgi:hypothetical protein
MIYKFKEFLLEGQIATFKTNLEINTIIDGSEHYFDRLSRSDNEPDEYGNTIIEESEIIDTINRSLKDIILKNMFNTYTWKDGKLMQDICIIDSETNLNIIVSLSKYVNTDKIFSYKMDILTTIRKQNFKPKQNTMRIYARKN